jgi:hypothetical protein
MADRLDFQRRRLTEAALGILPKAAIVLDERRSRPVWFDGLFLTAAALAREQSFFLSRQADLARTLGAGVVEGLEVEEIAGRPTALRISAGHGLTAAGEPVVLERDLVVELADVPGEKALERALGRPVRPTPPRETRGGLFVLALRPLEYTAEPGASYPTTIDEPRRLEDSVVREVALLTLLPFDDAAALGAPGLRRARAAERAFAGEGLALPPNALPLAALELAANAVVWLDTWLVRREAGLAASDVLGLGLASEPSRAAHFRQYDDMIEDLLDQRRDAGQGLAFSAAEHFSLLPAAGRLPAAAVGLAADPATGEQVLTQSFFPAQLPVELTLVPEDEVAAVVEESLLLPPIRLDAAEAVLESQPVLVLLPVPRAELGRLARELGRLTRPLLPRYRIALAPSKPIELLALVRARADARPPAPIAAPEERAWADLVAGMDTLWFARVRQLAAVDDLLPVLTPEIGPAPTAIVPESVAPGSTAEVTIGGRGLAGATSLTFDRDDISARILSATDALVRAEVRLLSTVPPGPRNFTLRTPRARLESIAFGLALNVGEILPAPQPELTAIRPDRVTAGQTVSLAILGQGLAGATAVTVDGGDVATAVTSATDGGILIDVRAGPNAAPGSRNVVVTTPQATLRSADFGLALVVEAAPVQPALAAIAPDRVAAGGTIEAMISGQGLDGAASLTFDHRDMAAEIGAVAADRLTAKVAVGDSVPPGPHNFVVATPRGNLESARFGLALLVEEAPPVMTSIRPDRVTVGGSVTVVISGRGLDGARELVFDRTDVVATIASATGSSVQATVRVATGAVPGARGFSLTTARGRLDSAAFGLAFIVEEPAPLLSAITPARGTQGQTVGLTIAGRGLDGASALAFEGTGLTATIGSVSSTVVGARLQIAATAAAGQRSFALRTPRGTLDSRTFGLAFVVDQPAPALTAVQPTSAQAGTTLTLILSGRGLTGANALAFDRRDISATITSVTDTSVQARVTVATTAIIGRRNFTLTTPRGTLDAASFGLAFTVTQRYGYLILGGPAVGGDLL